MYIMLSMLLLYLYTFLSLWKPVDCQSSWHKTHACLLIHLLSAGGFDDGRSFSNRRRAARSNLERTSFDVSIRPCVTVASAMLPT